LKTHNKNIKLTPATKSCGFRWDRQKAAAPYEKRYEARKLPLLSEMLEKVQEKAPQQAVYMKQKFKEYFW
jgi:hypothetical protein